MVARCPFDESAKLVQLSGSKTIIARQRYRIKPELAESIVTPDVGHDEVDMRIAQDVAGERLKIPGVFDPSWTTPSAAEVGLHRRSNAVGLSPRAATDGSGFRSPARAAARR